MPEVVLLSDRRTNENRNSVSVTPADTGEHIVDTASSIKYSKQLRDCTDVLLGRDTNSQIS